MAQALTRRRRCRSGPGSAPCVHFSHNNDCGKLRKEDRFWKSEFSIEGLLARSGAQLQWQDRLAAEINIVSRQGVAAPRVIRRGSEILTCGRLSHPLVQIRIQAGA